MYSRGIEVMKGLREAKAGMPGLDMSDKCKKQCLHRFKGHGNKQGA